MKLIILRDYDEASEWAAKYIRNRIRSFNPGPDRFFTLGLPTGTKRNGEGFVRMRGGHFCCGYFDQLANEEETETPEVPQQGTDAPPPYTSIAADTAFFDYKDDGNYPKPPSYNVATSLPSYDEAERSKAESSVPLMPTRDEDFAARDDFEDVDQLRVGNDGIFMLTFFMAFLFNWIGFFLSFCLTTSAAGRYGAVSGFGLSLVKWVLIVRFSTYFPGYFDGQYWLCIELGISTFLNPLPTHPDRRIRSYSRPDRCSRPDRRIRSYSRPDRRIRSYSRPDRRIRSYSRPDRPIRSYSRPDRPIRSYSRPDRRVRSYSRPDCPVRSYSRPDRPVRSYSRPDRRIRSYSRPDRRIRSYSRPDRPVRSYSRPDRRIRSYSRPDHPIRSYRPSCHSLFISPHTYIHTHTHTHTPTHPPLLLLNIITNAILDKKIK
ncbi:NEDD4 family-interacting protein 1 isoform X1 [Silurus asotus]|uniref:NEDD4 family-interacting protein 1 isoform X1 n=1 Tax=Silurus asotus TaxID=30991 RepID=A0AAD5FSM8_SILAS|nr:NEDD4 family-interacting protein 1 isoform X1 [Silurus asotus]